MKVWLNPKIKENCDKFDFFDSNNLNIINSFDECEVLIIVLDQEYYEFVRFSVDETLERNYESIVFYNDESNLKISVDNYDFSNLTFQEIKDCFKDKENVEFVKSIQELNFDKGISTNDRQK